MLPGANEFISSCKQVAKKYINNFGKVKQVFTEPGLSLVTATTGSNLFCITPGLLWSNFKASVRPKPKAC